MLVPGCIEWVIDDTILCESYVLLLPAVVIVSSAIGYDQR